MKKITTFILGICSMACSSTLTYDQAIRENQETFDGSDKQSDAQFLVEAKSFSILEEQVARLAVERGYAAAVQQYAKKIVEDHDEMNEEIDDLAGRNDIKVPVQMSVGHNQKYEELKVTTRAEFDKAFAKVIEDVYESHINLFKVYATTAKDDDIRAFAAKNLGLLRNNEEAADKLEQDLL